MQLVDIFPTTLAYLKLKSCDPNRMLEVLLDIGFEFETGDHKDNGGHTADQSLLDRVEFADAKREIELQTLEYTHSLGHSVEGIQVVSSWGNVVRDGDQIVPHIHPNSYVSGCFYLTGGASIEFSRQHCFDTMFSVEPTINFDASNPRTFKTFYITPEPGTLLLFPARLQHRVLRHSGPDRYSIGFNTMPLGSFGSPTMHLNLPRVPEAHR
jgi:uncharacterized protein (TIGR02466 family)